MLFNGTRNFIFGFAVGFGTGYISRELTPYLKNIARPAVKGVIKLSVRSFEKMKEGLFHFGEMMEDITEEVKVELKEESRKAKKVKRPRVVTPLVRPVETEAPIETTTPTRRPA